MTRQAQLDEDKQLPNWGRWSCYRANGFTRNLTFTSGGAALDISNYVIAFTAELLSGPYVIGSPLVRITKAATITSGPLGTAVLALTAVDTDIVQGIYTGVLKVTPPAGEPWEIHGEFAIG